MKKRERTVGFFFGKVGYTYDRRYTGWVLGVTDGSNRIHKEEAVSW
jgi:hypothetical protein